MLIHRTRANSLLVYLKGCSDWQQFAAKKTAESHLASMRVEGNIQFNCCHCEHPIKFGTKLYVLFANSVSIQLVVMVKYKGFLSSFLSLFCANLFGFETIFFHFCLENT